MPRCGPQPIRYRVASDRPVPPRPAIRPVARHCRARAVETRSALIARPQRAADRQRAWRARIACADVFRALCAAFGHAIGPRSLTRSRTKKLHRPRTLGKLAVSFCAALPASPALRVLHDQPASDDAPAPTYPTADARSYGRPIAVPKCRTTEVRIPSGHRYRRYPATVCIGARRQGATACPTTA